MCAHGWRRRNAATKPLFREVNKSVMKVSRVCRSLDRPLHLQFLLLLPPPPSDILHQVSIVRPEVYLGPPSPDLRTWILDFSSVISLPATVRSLISSNEVSCISGGGIIKAKVHGRAWRRYVGLTAWLHTHQIFRLAWVLSYQGVVGCCSLRVAA